MSRFGSAPLRALALLFLLSIPINLAAATAQIQIYLDTDNNPSTGCHATFGSDAINGVEQLLTTSIEVTSTSSTVTGVTRSLCDGSVFGSPLTVDTTGWPIGTEGASGISHIETHIPLSAFGGSLPAVQRVYFVGTTGGFHSSLFTSASGAAILYPYIPGRRHAVGRGAANPRSIVLDGQVGDWNGIQPLVSGGANGGITAITFQSISAFEGSSDLFFLFDTKLNLTAPIAIDDSYDGTQGRSLNVAAPGVLINDISPTGAALSALLVSPPEHGTVTLAPSGGFSYVNDGATAPVDHFTYKANDGTADSNTATVTINVEADGAPVARPDAYTVPHGGTLTVPRPGVLVNDTDPDGDRLTASVQTGPQHGTLTLNPDGSFTYTHDGSNSTTDSFRYRASDGVRTGSAIVSITIGPDAPPVALGDAYTVNEGGTLTQAAPGVLANDSDSDSPQALWSASLVSGPANGTLALNADGSFTYVHNGSETTFDSFTYVLNDGIVNSAPATVTITITPVNDVPVATADSYTTNEDTILNVLAPGVLANDTDPDSALTAVLVANAANGSVTLNANGSFTYAPNANFNGTDSFTYKANDGLVDSNTVTVTITVTAVNDAPALTVPGAQATNEDTPLGFTTISIADVDAGAGILQLTLTSVNGTLALGSTTGLTVSGNGTASITATGTLTNLNAALNGLTFTPAANYNGPASVSLTINDQGNTGSGGPLSDTQTINITVNPVNDPPVVNAATFSLAENSANGTSVGSVTFADVESGTETYAFAITAGNTNNAFAINPATGAITVNNAVALDFETTPSFSLTVTVTDNGAPAQSGSATITINLTDVNEAPVASNATFAINENSANGTAVGTVTASDQDAGQTLTFAITAGNGSGAFAINPGTGAITVANSTPLDFETTPSFSLTVTVTDNGAPVLSGTATITISLNDVNEAPVVNPATFSIPENSPNGTAVGTVTFTDPDAGQTHSFAITAGNTGGAFAIDGTGNITVANVAALNFETTPTFSLTVTVTDNGAPVLNGSATVTVNLTDVNDAPAIANQTFTVPENSANGTAVGTVVASDEDAGQTLTYAITGGDPSGVFAINPSTGAITVANSALLNFEATPSFSLTVQVTDNAGSPLSSSATVTVNLIDVNESPVANPATFAVDENSPNGTAVGTVTFTEPDGGQTHTFAITGGNTNGAFAIDNAGNITVANVAALDFETTPSFTLTVLVTDNGVPALSGSAFITINLNNVNEAPVLTVPGPQSGPEDTPFGPLPISIADPDAGGGTVQVTIAVNNGVVSLTTTAGLTFIVGSGSGANMTFTGTLAAVNTALNGMTGGPSFNFNGITQITITVDDLGNTGSGGNLTDTATIDVNITPVNDPPVAVGDSYTVDGGATLTVAAPGVLGNDSDVDLPPQTLTAVLETGPAHATSFTLNPDGSFTYVNDGLGATSDSFTYHVSDGTDVSFFATVNITVQYNDPPHVNAATFSVAENTANTTNVGTPITFTDAESATETYTFAITGGNTAGAFAINSSSGQITVANSAALDFETTPSFSLTVQVTDNGSPVRAGTATVTVNLTNVNEAPVVNPATVSIAENTPNGTTVTTVTFTDPDAGQTHTFAITAGNTGGAFAIDGSGAITVADVAALNFETTPTFSLTVQVTDNGAPILSGTATITINLTDVNEAPAPTGSFSVAENSANGTIVGTVATNDPDAGQTHTFAITGGSGNGVFAIDPNTGQITVSDSTQLNFEVNPSFTLTVQATDNGSPVLSGSGTITITVTDVNEVPVVNDQTFTINENLANAATVGTVAFTDPDVGQTHTWSITGGNTGGAFAINSSGVITVATSSAVDFESTPTFTLTVQVTDNGTPNLSDTAIVTINLNNLNEAPTAVGDSYNYIANTELRIAGHAGTANAIAFTTAPTNPLTNDTDPDSPASGFATLTVVPVSSGLSTNNGTFSIAADGTMVYTPPAGFTGTDTVTYQLTDGTNTVPGTITLTMSGTDVPWYVKNNDPTADGTATKDGTSSFPFNTLAAASAASQAGQIIYVHNGDGTRTGQNSGITLKANQQLLGQGVALVVNGSTTLIAAGSKSFIGSGGGAGVTALNAGSIEVRGLDIDAATNAIVITTNGANGGSATINTNTLNSSSTNALDVNAGGSGQFVAAVSNNVATATGNAIDMARTAGTGFITSFDSNSVPGTSAGGINIVGFTFDNVPGGAIQTVAGGTTVIGSGSGNRISSGGLTLTNVQGTLNFGGNLQIFTDSGTALSVSGTGAGFTLTVNPNFGVLEANAGTAADILNAAVDLQLASLTSKSSPGGTPGVSLANVTGTFSAPSGSTIQSAGSTDFSISGGTVAVTYGGTIFDDSGQLISISNSSGTKSFTGAIDDLDGAGDPIGGGAANNGGGISLTNAGTVTFSGGLNLSTGGTNAFSATGGGTINATQDNTTIVNTIATTTGLALNVVNTTIGASNLTFRSISANGAANAIVLNNTGASGGLIVTGNGGSCTALASTCTGGVIQSTTSHAISLTSTLSPSFTFMKISNVGRSGIFGTAVTNFTLNNSVIDGVNTSHTGADANVAFNTGVAGTENNVAGNVSITNNHLNNSYQAGIDIQNYAGTIANLTITGNTLTSNTSNTLSLGTAINVVANRGPANHASISAGSISGNTIQNFPAGAGIQVIGGNSNSGQGVTIASAGSPLLINGNTITGAGPGPAGIGTNGIAVTAGESTSAFFSIGGASGNNITNVRGDGIDCSLFGNGTEKCIIANNVIVANNTAGSNGINTGADQSVASGSAGNGTLYLDIHNNNVSGTTGVGILATVSSVSSTGIYWIQNNTVAAPTTLSGTIYGIRVSSGNGTGNPTVCLKISGNNTAGSTNGAITAPGIGIRQSHADPGGGIGTFNIDGLSPNPSNDTQMETYVGNAGGQNPGSANGTFGLNGVAVISAGGTYHASTCSIP